ncbi:GNAT family N-acetyltransferase [Rhizohabitans arisaemae]|uniref:GNAT family N-acetyltransferase n=1 Tax=Rhizohabitans arisaemae TaxID=2720610 RepID=UPI0024B19D3F|nr:GNAT family N-acetyltransferase [Rhizohabitans arisaemae]
MNPRTVLAAYDEQIRRNPSPETPAGYVEREDGVVRVLTPGGWSGVTWCGIESEDADRVIAAQLRRFSGWPGPWEWKHHSHDRPADLPGRLLAAGFVTHPPETLLVAETAEIACDATPPPGVEFQAVEDEGDVAALVSVHNQVFGGDHSALGRIVAAGLTAHPRPLEAVVALAGRTPIAAGRVEFHAGTDFASLWGGGTLPEWRSRGVFRALVARRAGLAADRGFRYLQVDASPESRPILRRLGFAELAVTTPFTHPGGG